MEPVFIGWIIINISCDPDPWSWHDTIDIFRNQQSSYYQQLSSPATCLKSLVRWNTQERGEISAHVTLDSLCTVWVCEGRKSAWNIDMNEHDFNWQWDLCWWESVQQRICWTKKLDWLLQTLLRENLWQQQISCDSSHQTSQQTQLVWPAPHLFLCLKRSVSTFQLKHCQICFVLFL